MNFIKEFAIKVLELWLWVIITALTSLSSQHKSEPIHPPLERKTCINPDKEEPIINDDVDETNEEDKPEENQEKSKFEIQKKDITDKETGELLETRVMVHILGNLFFFIKNLVCCRSYFLMNVRIFVANENNNQSINA